jgi:hypothetical protein
MRPIAGVAALNSLAALVLQLVLLIQLFQAQDQSAGAAVWRFFGFFTLLTNILVTAVLGRIALDPRSRTRPGAATLEVATVAAIVLVGVVYAILLAPLWQPQGLQRVADQMLHTLAPILTLAAWLTGPHGRLRWRDAAICLVWPTAYCLYALARGRLDGWYAYPFLDPSTIGYGGAAISAAILASGVCGLGIALVAADRQFARWRPSFQKNPI